MRLPYVPFEIAHAGDVFLRPRPLYPVRDPPFQSVATLALFALQQKLGFVNISSYGPDPMKVDIRAGICKMLAGTKGAME